MARAPVRRRPTNPTPPTPALRAGALRTAGSEGPSADGRKRVAIESVSPEIDAGRFPAKRTLGEKVTVEADVFADGHDALACVVRHRHHAASTWTEAPMVALVNDRWRGEFPVPELGRHVFTVEAWVDPFETWSRQFAKRVEAGQDVTLELEVAAKMVEAAAARVGAPDAAKLLTYAAQLRAGKFANFLLPTPPLRGGAPRTAGSPGADLGNISYQAP